MLVHGRCGPGIALDNSAKKLAAGIDDVPSNATALRRCRMSACADGRTGATRSGVGANGAEEKEETELLRPRSSVACATSSMNVHCTWSSLNWLAVPDHWPVLTASSSGIPPSAIALGTGSAVTASRHP